MFDRNGITRWPGLLLTLLSLTVLASEPLPEPLTFPAALATASNPQHFQLEGVEQQLHTLRAELGIEAGNYGFTLDLKGRLREVGESDFALPRDDGGDNAASLVLYKPLYDFGLQNSRERVLLRQLEALELQKSLLIQQRRLSIMRRFFDVLNADNNFISENEALAIGFIRFDNAREDFELGRIAEIEVLRLQSEYEVIRQRRNLAAQQQRLTRSQLAEAMGFPGRLPSDLVAPKISTDRPLPEDIEGLLTQAMAYSLEARVALANTQAAQAAIMIAEAEDNPSVDFEVEVSSYERESRLRDDWRASLYVEIPLYSSAAPARVDRARAQHRRALAEQQRLQSNLRLEVLELWQKIQQQQLVLAGRQVEQDYRDRYLDRSRAEYELEFKSDLGDSMILFSRANAARQKALYDFELAYQQLQALVGADFINQSAANQ